MASAMVSTPQKRRHEESAYSSVAPLSGDHMQGTPCQRPMAKLDTSSHPNAADGTRVHSPNNIMDAHNVIMPSTPSTPSATRESPRESKRTLSFKTPVHQSPPHDDAYDEDPAAEKRVTIWNWREQRKLSGNSAPFKKNLRDYIRKHPDWEEYVGQDKDEVTGKKLAAKRMKPPAPIDPDHPWFTMQRTGSLPPLPSPSASAHSAPHTSAYGTRSRETRLQDSEFRGLRSTRPAPPHATFCPSQLSAELHEPLRVLFEPHVVISRRRSVDLEVRRAKLAAEVPSEEEEFAEEPRYEREAREKSDREAAWAAAVAHVAQDREVQESCVRAELERSEARRRDDHAAAQWSVVGKCMERIQGFKKRRVSLSAAC